MHPKVQEAVVAGVPHPVRPRRAVAWSRLARRGRLADHARLDTTLLSGIIRLVAAADHPDYPL